MRIAIFGTGKLYERYKSKLRDGIEIVNLVDNDKNKIGTYIDGVKVISPEELYKVEYDYICLLSMYEYHMRKQLIKLGISRSVIVDSERWERFFVKDKYVEYLADERDGDNNILIFSHALSSTGAQNVQLPLIEALLIRSCNVRVISKSDGPLRERLSRMGVSVIIMEDYRIENPTFVKLVDWADMVIINTLWLYYVVQEIDKITVRYKVDIKIKWWIHESGVVENIEKTEFARLITLPYVSVYAVSVLLIRKLEDYCGIHNKITLFMFGIRDYCQENEQSDNKKDIKDVDVMTFSIIGIIEDIIKGQDIFIDMVKKLPIEYREKARFLIVGAGKLTESEMNDIEKIPQIHVTGEIPNEDIYKIYNESDVIVSCSREDAMSVVILEGFMNRKPAIMSDAIGVAELITDGVEGFIVKSEDVDGFAQKVMWMIDHRQQCKEMGNKARYIYESTFTMDKFKERLERVFLADL